MYFYSMNPNPLNNNKPFGIIVIYGNLPQSTFVYLDVENKQWVGPVSKIYQNKMIDFGDTGSLGRSSNYGSGGGSYIEGKQATYTRITNILRDCFIRLKFFKRCDRIIEEIGEYSE